MKRTFLSLMTLFAIAITVSSCLKGTEPLQPRDPAAEKDTIQKFITSKGYTMVEDENLKGLMYEIVNKGSATDTISKDKPVAVVKYKGMLLNSTVFGESENQSFDLRNAGGLIPSFYTALFKVGKGGQIRFVTPSAYAYGPYVKGSIPANSPLYFEIEVTDIKSPGNGY